MSLLEEVGEEAHLTQENSSLVTRISYTRMELIIPRFHQGQVVVEAD